GFEALAQFGGRQVSVPLGVDQRLTEDVHAALNAACARKARFRGAAKLLRRQCVRDARASVRQRFEHVLLIRDELRPITRLELGARMKARCLRYRALLGNPLSPTAV